MITCILAVALFSGIIPPVPEDLDKSFNSLKEAVEKNDPALVKSLAVQSADMARKLTSQAPPLEDEQDKVTWAKQVEYAKNITTYAEFALADAALRTTTPATAIDLITTLEKQNPASKYLDDAYAKYFIALRQTGSASKIPGVAAEALKHFPNNEDLLLVLADDALTKKQNDRALSYSERLLSAVERHPRPENVPAGDWERKKSASATRAHWIAGMIHAEKGQYFEADKDLRAALPNVKSDDVMHGSTLFYLGLANYQLGAAALDRARVLEAATFSEQSAKIKSPFSDKAWQNAQAMRNQAAMMNRRR